MERLDIIKMRVETKYYAEEGTYEGVSSVAEKSLVRGLICVMFLAFLDPEREVGKRGGVVGTGELTFLLFCFLDGGRTDLWSKY